MKLVQLIVDTELKNINLGAINSKHLDLNIFNFGKYGNLTPFIKKCPNCDFMKDLEKHVLNIDK